MYSMRTRGVLIWQKHSAFPAAYFSFSVFLYACVRTDTLAALMRGNAYVWNVQNNSIPIKNKNICIHYCYKTKEKGVRKGTTFSFTYKVAVECVWL